MRQPLKLFLALVLAATLAAGCGSDDDSPDGGGGGGAASEQAENGENSEQADGSNPAAKPKKKSARAEMVSCMEDEGFEVSHEGDDEEKATNYTVEAGGKKKAEIIIHSNKNDAAGAARKVGEEKGINSIPFGRVEFRNNDDATDTEAGVLANCVAEAYVH
ncbi:MAG TPA: hypothetical protein VGV90_04725 [Solirubrobacteraceae bacterium]|nr:hypothetical protein [Solirubrobacteraceae bacterium]